jgi:hypothetical protein
MNWKGTRTEVFEKAAVSFRLTEAQGIYNNYTFSTYGKLELLS